MFWICILVTVASTIVMYATMYMMGGIGMIPFVAFAVIFYILTALKLARRRRNSESRHPVLGAGMGVIIGLVVAVLLTNLAWISVRDSGAQLFPIQASIMSLPVVIGSIILGGIFHPLLQLKLTGDTP